MNYVNPRLTLFYYICQYLDSMTLKNNTTTIVKGIIAALLLLCLIDADYGFYQAMRTLISFGFAFLTYRYYKSGDSTNAIIYLCLLIVFQPLLKIGLGRGIWMVVDIVVAVYLVYEILRLKHKGIDSKDSAVRIQTDKPEDTSQRSNLRINFPDKN